MILDRINKEIDREYEQKIRDARETSEKRKTEIYEKLPKIKEIDSYMSSLGILLGYKAMGRKPSAFIIEKLLPQSSDLTFEQIKLEIKELEQLKENLLRNFGYSSDYMANPFQCKNCSDTGYIKNKNGIGVVCECRKAIYAKKLKEIANVPENDTFENFNLDFYSEQANKEIFGINVSPREQMDGACKRCLQFVDDFEDKSKNNMVFVGKSGLGKTFLANCIINALTDKGYSCFYVSATDLFKYFMPKLYGMDESYDMAEFILNCNLLVIDDLGSEKQTETRYAELLEVLNKREANNKFKLCKTIITTNLMPAEIKKNYDERVFSRIYGEYDLLRFAGEDIRIKKKMM